MSEEDKVATNGHIRIRDLLPGAALDADEKEEIVYFEHYETGAVLKAGAVFAFLDGKTRAQYNRIMERPLRRGKPLDYDGASKWLFRKKCKRIIGIQEDDLDLEGKSLIDYFAETDAGHGLMNIVVNKYLARQIPAAAESSKSD